MRILGPNSPMLHPARSIRGVQNAPPLLPAEILEVQHRAQLRLSGCAESVRPRSCDIPQRKRMRICSHVGSDTLIQGQQPSECQSSARAIGSLIYPTACEEKGNR